MLLQNMCSTKFYRVQIFIKNRKNAAVVQWSHIFSFVPISFYTRSIYEFKRIWVLLILDFPSL